MLDITEIVFPSSFQKLLHFIYTDKITHVYRGSESDFKLLNLLGSPINWIVKASQRRMIDTSVHSHSVEIFIPLKVYI